MQQIAAVTRRRPGAEPVAGGREHGYSRILDITSCGCRQAMRQYGGGSGVVMRRNVTGRAGNWTMIALSRDMLARARLIALSVCIAAAAATLWAPSADAQGAVRSVHDDWQIRCETPPGAQAEQCALFQSVVAEDRANVGITVLVLRTADQKTRLMRVQAPLGVLLPAGLGLKIDQADVGRAGFVRCLPRGCYAEVVMDDNLVKQMRTGQTATFFIFQTPEEGIGFPMSLKGFGEGWDKLP
jgi:invasion protein IalB